MSDEGSGAWYVTSGRSECPTCGAQASEVRRPGWWRRFRGWLIHGTRGEHLGVCPNGHEWSWSTFRFQGLIGYRRVRLPAAVIGAVMHKRKALPLPIHYVAAAGFGVVLGVALDLLLGWAWWLVAAATVVVVWLLYLSTAFTDPHRVRLDDLLEPIDWERAEARRLRRLERAVASGRVMAYGVDGWPGVRRARGDGAFEQVALSHGRHEAPPSVTVVTNRGDVDSGYREAAKWNLVQWLVAMDVAPPHHGTPEELMEWQAELDRVRQERVPPWEAGAITVDGADLPCEVVRWQGRWAAILEVEDVWLEVTASGLDPADVVLQRLTTLEGYD